MHICADELALITLTVCFCKRIYCWCKVGSLVVGSYVKSKFNGGKL